MDFIGTKKWLNEHLDFHGNMDNYFKSKLKLFKNLSSSKTAIINIDDPYSIEIANNTSAKIIFWCKHYTG